MLLDLALVLAMHRGGKLPSQAVRHLSWALQELSGEGDMGGGERLRLDRALLAEVRADYLDDARACDEEFFGGDDFQRAFDRAAATAVDAPQVIAPEKVLTPQELRRCAAVARALREMARELWHARARIAELEAAVNEAGLQKFRARQLWRWVWRHGLTSFDEMSDLGKHVREQFAAHTANLGHPMGRGGKYTPSSKTTKKAAKISGSKMNGGPRSGAIVCRGNVRIGDPGMLSIASRKMLASAPRPRGRGRGTWQSMGNGRARVFFVFPGRAVWRGRAHWAWAWGVCDSE